MKETGAMSVSLFCLPSTVSLLEVIQQISQGMGNDHAVLQGIPLTTFI